jgi:hypothetical protein
VHEAREDRIVRCELIAFKSAEGSGQGAQLPLGKRSLTVFTSLSLRKKMRIA